MQNGEPSHLTALAPSGARINVWTASAAEAQALAEALYEARPGWRLRIDGKAAVFSREGRIVDLVRSDRRPARTG